MKTKKILLTIALFTFVAFVNAQEKYQFMSISYTDYGGMRRELQISIDGNDFLVEDIELKKKEKATFNTNPLLAKVKEYQDKGWEVMNLYTTAVVSSVFHTAYLRKKK